jgi:hypothetical protein
MWGKDLELELSEYLLPLKLTPDAPPIVGIRETLHYQTMTSSEAVGALVKALAEKLVTRQD